MKSNASANGGDRESDPLQPWAIELVNSLSDSEKKVLQNVTSAPGTSSLMKAAQVVQKIVQRGARHVARSVSKPGPKKNTNPTDEDIDVMISIIRMLLDVPRQLTRPQILSVLSSVLDESNVLLGKSLFLLLTDYYSLIHGLREWVKHESESSAVTAIHEWIQELEDLRIAYDEQSWKKFVNVDKQKVQGRPEQQLIVEITKHLGLHQAPLIESGNVELFPDDQGIATFPEVTSISELELRRRDVFWSAIHRLIHFKTLVTQRQFSWCSPKIEEMCTKIDLEISMGDTNFGVRRKDRKATERPHDMRRDGMLTVYKALVRAAKRQGISPVHDSLAKLPSGFFRPLPPGVVSLAGESVPLKGA